MKWDPEADPFHRAVQERFDHAMTNWFAINFQRVRILAERLNEENTGGVIFRYGEDLDKYTFYRAQIHHSAQEFYVEWMRGSKYGSVPKTNSYLFRRRKW